MIGSMAFHSSLLSHTHIQEETMNTLKAIQNCFPPTKHVFLHSQILRSKRNTLLFLCKSSDQGSSQPEGDINKQELLAKIAQLQAQKVRLTDYLDERSAYLTQFAEEANAEFDEIGESTLKGLDEAEARIMEKLGIQMQDFEETAESNRQEIEEDEKKLWDFEDQMDKDLNEGLFFKSLTTKAPEDRVKAKEEAEKLREINKEVAGSKIRKNVYLALIVLMGVGIADALITASDWRKVAALGVILVGLLSQFIYEQGISAKRNKMEDKE
ncbi:hypothetical protein AQUCO_00900740v1 [Aquilegia coerulea]|uniref:8-amino-7-oxononanoate synthase n=1 Tax=Aquilegia coerulea TaxID=218851 RepID=A0A2G5EF69_AQUCA|nr:hypothetical protein AQUCO_00900740v1 [Aquilegia coerulea]